MKVKEKKGGELTNSDIEKELHRDGGPARSDTNYIGSQDTGDEKIRPLGTEVQKRDGVDQQDDNSDKS